MSQKKISYSVSDSISNSMEVNKKYFWFFHLSLSTMAKELLIIVWLLFGHSSEQPLGQDETYPEFGNG